MARTLDALQGLRRQDRRSATSPAARYVATEACRRAANCARIPRPGARRDRHRARDHLDRRGGAARRRRLRAAARIRACPTRSSSTSAAARPRSSGCARRRALRRRAPEILGSISLPFGVVTFTERFGGIEVSPAIYRAMVAEARGGAGAVREEPPHPPPGRGAAGCRCSAARAR